MNSAKRKKKDGLDKSISPSISDLEKEDICSDYAQKSKDDIFDVDLFTINIFDFSDVLLQKIQYSH